MFPRVDLGQITKESFRAEFLKPNKGCVLTNGMESWPIYERWRGDDFENRLVVEFGEKKATVLWSGVTDTGFTEYGQEKVSEMTMEEYFKIWKRGNEYKPYLKDFHFVLEASTPVEGLYVVPHVFEDDLLTPFFLQEDGTDFRFLYLGPANSFTPRHHDVFHSYSWSANIFGKKLWKFYIEDKVFQVIQNEGEIIFVPAGMYHDVTNMEDTLSINHNWINTSCFAHVEKFLQIQLQETQHSLRDVESTMDSAEFNVLVQKIMRLNIGINTEQFDRLKLRSNIK